MPGFAQGRLPVVPLGSIAEPSRKSPTEFFPAGRSRW